MKRRLDANSIAAKRLSNTVFYLDESIYSRRLAEVMRQAGATVVTPFEAGLAGAADESWLTTIGQRRWLALMRDQNIRRRLLERQALVAAEHAWSASFLRMMRLAALPHVARHGQLRNPRYGRQTSSL